MYLMNTITLETESDFKGWRSQIRPLLEKHVPLSDIKLIILPSENIYQNGPNKTYPKSPHTLILTRQMASLIVAVFSSGDPERFDLLYTLLEHIRDHKTLDTEHDPLLIKLRQISHKAKRNALSLREKLLPPSVSGRIILRETLPVALLDSQAHALLALRPDQWLVRTEGRIICAHERKLFFAPAPPETAFLDDEALFEFALKEGICTDHSLFWRSIVPFPVKPNDEFVAKIPSLAVLRAYATDCQFCPLCKPASRTVTGEGNPKAQLMFVGEQPGDQEDLQGRPFVGPAGQLFDQALAECGIERAACWITNAVKHFRFTPYGYGKRLHQKPDAEHIKACAPWLQRERELLKPKVTIMMGVTGGTAILGRPVTVSRERSKILTLQDGSIGLVTVHPSFLLRQADEASRSREYDHFVADLKLACSALS